MPPPNWAPPADWPPAPEGWQWWEKLPPSPLRFHLLGAVVVAAAVVGWMLVVAVLGFTTAACPPAPGNPALLHLGVGVAGAVLIAVAGGWAWRARRFGYRWWPWAAVAAVITIGVTDAVVSVRVSGCPFVF